LPKKKSDISTLLGFYQGVRDGGIFANILLREERFFYKATSLDPVSFLVVLDPEMIQ
jgi:hypothetical protein